MLLLYLKNRICKINLIVFTAKKNMLLDVTLPYTDNISELDDGWVHPWVGLGWIGLGRKITTFCGLGWVEFSFG